MGTAAQVDGAIDRMKPELQRLFDNIRDDLDRIELMIVALSAFDRSIPDYEPRFHHMQDMLRNVHELRR
jgi:hypothetical protein